MGYYCQRCDDEITYTLGNTDFEHGLLCDQCYTRYERYDEYRVWCELRRRRAEYHSRREEEETK